MMVADRFAPAIDLARFDVDEIVRRSGFCLFSRKRRGFEAARGGWSPAPQQEVEERPPER
jgi:hypothetical protein